MGRDPARRRTNVPNYGRVKYEGVYPGVDVIYYGTNRRPEYDFLVAPGADARAIRMQIEGAGWRANTWGDVPRYRAAAAPTSGRAAALQLGLRELFRGEKGRRGSFR